MEELGRLVLGAAVMLLPFLVPAVGVPAIRRVLPIRSARLATMALTSMVAPVLGLGVVLAGLILVIKAGGMLAARLPAGGHGPIATAVMLLPVLLPVVALLAIRRALPHRSARLATMALASIASAALGVGLVVAVYFMVGLAAESLFARFPVLDNRLVILASMLLPFVALVVGLRALGRGLPNRCAKVVTMARMSAVTAVLGFGMVNVHLGMAIMFAMRSMSMPDFSQVRYSVIMSDWSTFLLFGGTGFVVAVVIVAVAMLVAFLVSGLALPAIRRVLPNLEAKTEAVALSAVAVADLGVGMVMPAYLIFGPLDDYWMARTFARVVAWLILAAVVLLVFHRRVRAVLIARRASPHRYAKLVTVARRSAVAVFLGVGILMVAWILFDTAAETLGTRHPATGCPVRITLVPTCDD
jgi:hypothetical protein